MRFVPFSLRERSLKFISLPPFLLVGILATLLVSLSFALQGRIDINLADEGFLWYGTWRTALGEVPLRDFQSYDPGRYLWGALWFHVLGNEGILTLRISNALFQIIGLTCGLLVLRRLTRSPGLLTSGGIVLVLWMFPRHKLFESSIALAAVYMATLLVEVPSLRRHLVAGVFVGLAAFWGRQHGFYTAVSFFLLIGFIWLKLDRRCLLQRGLLWGSGIVLGYSPMLIMLAVVPGLWHQFWESLVFLVRLRNTNLPLPIPTPWSVPIGSLGWLTASHQISIGLGFMLLPLFNGAALGYLCWQKPARLRTQSVLAAATFLSLTYIHYAFSRADLSHLAQGIDPMLLGIMAILAYALKAGRRVWGCALALGLTLFTALGIGFVSPGISKLRSPADFYAEHIIRGDRLILPQPTTQFIKAIQQFYDLKVSPDEGIFLAPHIPALYAILERRSPIWDIYLLFPETQERQLRIIEELRQQRVNWAILGDVALDGRQDLRFQNTHPLLWREFSEQFTPIQPTNLPENYQILNLNP